MFFGLKSRRKSRPKAPPVTDGASASNHTCKPKTDWRRWNFWLAISAFTALLAKFFLGGFFGFPEMSAGDFGLGLGAVLAVWQAGRAVTRPRHENNP